MKNLIWILSLLLISLSAGATGNPGPLLTYEGVLQDGSGNPITTTSSVIFRILTPTSCVVYEEMQNVTPDSDGEFSVIVGTGTRTDTTSNTADRIFASSGNVNCNFAAAENETSFIRMLHIKIGSTDLSPDITLNNVPTAINALRLEDKQASDFVAKAEVNSGASCGGGSFLTWDAATNTFNCAAISSIPVAAIPSTGVTAGTYGSAALVPVITVGNDGRLTAVSTVAAGAGGTTGPASGDLSGNYPSPVVSKLSGVPLTIASLSSGQVLKTGSGGSSWVNGTLGESDISNLITDLSNKVSFAQTPACASNQVWQFISVSSGFGCVNISLPASQIAGGTFTGSASDNVLKAGDAMTGNLSFTYGSNLVFIAPFGAAMATIKSPSAMSSSYSLILPTAQATSAGQILTNDGAGNLSWTNPGSAGILAQANGGTGVTDPSTIFVMKTPQIGSLNLGSTNSTVDITAMGIKRLSFATTGYIGVGTTSPGYMLDVAGAINATAVKINGVDVGTGGSSPWTSVGGAIYNNNSGNVGIGTTLPATSALMVYGGGASLASPLTVRSSSASGVSGITFSPQASASNVAQIGYDNGNQALRFRSTPGGVSAFIFDTQNAASPYQFLNANVGIGVLSPAYKLDVAGIIRSSAGGFMFPDGTTQTTASTGGSSTWAVSGANIYNSNTGNVGIGTDAPGSKLDVSGPINSAAYSIGSTLALTTNASGSVAVGTGTSLPAAASSSVAVGVSTLQNITTGSENVAVGANSMLSATTATDNVAVGESALANVTTGGNNVGVGEYVLHGLTTGSSNISIGVNSLSQLQTGSANTAIGNYAAYALEQGGVNNSNSGNTMLGAGAGQTLGSTSATPNSNNLFLGYQAGFSQTQGSGNILIGALAQAPSSTSSNYLNIGGAITAFPLNSSPNVGIGTTSPAYPLNVYGSTGGVSGSPIVVRNTSGSGLSGIGFASNAAPAPVFSVGYYNSSSSAYLRANGVPMIFDTVSAASAFSFQSGNVGVGVMGATTKLQVAGEISPSADNTYSLGDAALRFTQIFATNGTISTSDARQKKEITNSDLGLKFVNDLRPVSFRWRSGPDSDVHYGLIAQETEKIVNDSRAMAGHHVKAGDQTIISHDPKSDAYGIKYSELISPLIKAVQELYHKFIDVESHQAEQDRDLASVKAKNAAMKSYLCAKDPAAPFCH